MIKMFVFFISASISIARSIAAASRLPSSNSSSYWPKKEALAALVTSMGVFPLALEVATKTLVES